MLISQNQGSLPSGTGSVIEESEGTKKKAMEYSSPCTDLILIVLVDYHSSTNDVKLYPFFRFARGGKGETSVYFSNAYYHRQLIALVMFVIDTIIRAMF